MIVFVVPLYEKDWDWNIEDVTVADVEGAVEYAYFDDFGVYTPLNTPKKKNNFYHKTL